MATLKLEISDEDDLCNLFNPTQKDIVSNLKKRFQRNQIYVSCTSAFFKHINEQLIDL